MTKYEMFFSRLEAARDNEWRFRDDAFMGKFWRGARLLYEGKLANMTLAECEKEADA